MIELLIIFGIIIIFWFIVCLIESQFDKSFQKEIIAHYWYSKRIIECKDMELIKEYE